MNRVAVVVYVDSGSSDGSVEQARSLGVNVLELDLSIPFTAARARNAGLDYLLELAPHIHYVQFVDGDCEVVSGWLEQAQEVLTAQPEIVVVCGRRRERFPNTSIYNRLCDIEWDTPVGEAKACGGDAMMRVSALKAVGGYNPQLIAGEEPELCVRLRQNGGQILRIDAEMTLHDAQMTRFGQWWKRSVRAGHAYAEGAWLHGRPPERHWVKETRSISLWGIIVPVGILATALPTKGLSFLLLAFYPLMAYRVYQYIRRSGRRTNDAILFGLSCTLGKLPQAQGLLRFYWGKLFKQPSRLIEYNSGHSTQESIQQDSSPEKSTGHLPT
jgi:glycosyltransferase involved in cell wall biosynthesis